MERIVVGLPELVIEKVVSSNPVVLDVRYSGEVRCPHCGGMRLRIKDTFQRLIKSIPVRCRASTLQIVCHKYLCRDCGQYFNTRLPGVKLWNRSTELLKKSVFWAYNKGYSCSDIAVENNIGLASVERYYCFICHLLPAFALRGWLTSCEPRRPSADRFAVQGRGHSDINPARQFAGLFYIGSSGKFRFVVLHNSYF